MICAVLLQNQARNSYVSWTRLGPPDPTYMLALPHSSCALFTPLVFVHVPLTLCKELGQ